MNRNIIIAGVVILVLILAIGGYMILGSKSPKDTLTPSPQTNETNQQPALGGAKSLRDLFTGGVSQQCTYTDAGVAGTTYVGNSKMRTDFTTMVNGQSTGTHMIMEGQTMYMWMEGQTTGYKMAFDPTTATQPAEGTKAPANNNIDPDKKIDYNCDAWVVDNSKFTLPADITFTDFSSMMGGPTGTTMKENGSDSTEDAKARQCAVCDSLTGDAQVQCKISLNCN